MPPADVEKVLLTHPDIMDAGVVGVPDEAAGELPMAFVVKKRNAKLTEKDVMDYVAGMFERNIFFNLTDSLIRENELF